MNTTFSKKDSQKTIWISWESHTRSQNIARELNIIYYEFNYKRFRYLKCAAKTIATILKIKPSSVFVQNPSIILNIVALVFRPIYKYRIIVDCHNAGIRPLEGKIRLLNKIAEIVLLLSDVIIVTNQNLAARVARVNRNVIVSPDPIPKFPKANLKKMPGKYNVLVILSWKDDEPFLEILDAAYNIGEDYNFFFTGAHPQLPSKYLRKTNINLLGYINKDDYLSYLASVDFTITLTKRDDCLVCGAYESVAASKPAILSDTEALRDHFSQGCLFSAGTSEKIIDSIFLMTSNLPAMNTEIKQLSEKLQHRWLKDHLPAIKEHTR